MDMMQQKLMAATGRVHQLEDELLQLRAEMAFPIHLLASLVHKLGQNGKLLIDKEAMQKADQLQANIFFEGGAEGVTVRIEAAPEPPGRGMVEVVPPGAMPPPMPQG